MTHTSHTSPVSQDSPVAAGASRRSFLRNVGLTGGAGAMFATMGALGLAPTAQAASREPAFRAPSPGDFSLKGRAAAKVVVVGGGIAGLAAAYELGKAGYGCTVLEARGRTGGRNFTVRGGDTTTDTLGNRQTARFSDGQYMNAGPGRIPQWMVTLDYCRELGVPVEVFTNENANAYLFNEKAGMKAPVRYRTAKADMYGYVAELLAKASDKGALDRQITADDQERLLEFLKDFGDIGDTLDYTGSPRRGYRVDPAASRHPGEELGPVPAASEVFASGVGRYFAFEFEYDQAMLMFQPVGGMDRIPAALTRAVGERRIRTGAAVTEIKDTAHGVTVTYTQGAAPGASRRTTASPRCPPTSWRRPRTTSARPSRAPWRPASRPRPTRSGWSTGAAGGRATTGSSAASPRRTWTSRTSGTRPTATSANAARSSATTTPVRTQTRTRPSRPARGRHGPSPRA